MIKLFSLLSARIGTLICRSISAQRYPTLKSTLRLPLLVCLTRRLLMIIAVPWKDNLGRGFGLESFPSSKSNLNEL